VNVWAISGHLGQDPRLRVTPSGTAVLNLNVALRVRIKGDDGKWTDQTEWIDVTMFGTRCEALSNMLQKGMRVGASGEMRVRRYTARDGTPKAQVELIAHDIEPLDRRPGAGADDVPRTSRPMDRGQGQGGYRAPQHHERSAYGAQGGGAPSGGQGGFIDPDDDIPF
jgi:single-strand DNA-binding protein